MTAYFMRKKKDVEKIALMQAAYNSLKGKLNWPAYVILTLNMMGHRKPDKPFAYVNWLLGRPDHLVQSNPPSVEWVLKQARKK